MKVYWESYGCSANQADMERILGILKSMGFELTEDPRSADIIILNTCAVKLTTENRMISRYRALAKFGKPVIITGCLPRMNLKRCSRDCKGFAAILDPNAIDKLPEVLTRVLSGERGIVEFSQPHWDIFALPSVQLHKVIHIIPISYGCLGNCAFCGVKNVRGKLVSVPISEIRRDFELALKAGKKEFWITSQDNGVYGWDIGTNLNALLKALLEIEGKYRIRVGMMNPGGAKTLVPEIFEYFNDDRVYKFVHIPVQSGSNAILRAMKRQHTVEDFVELVDKFRSAVPDITISTDIIVGFPGETEEDFKATVDLIKETRPDIVNVSKFYPRPGTEAERMKKVPTQIISQRTRELAKLVEEIAYESNKRMVGRVEEILVSDEKDGKPVGRTGNYKQVFFDEPVELGEFYTAKIIRAGKRSLRAKLSEDKNI